MVPSVRWQAIQHKKRIGRQARHPTNPKEALKLLQEERGLRDVSRTTGVSLSTVERMKKMFKERSPQPNPIVKSIAPPGGRPKITKGERSLINERLTVAAERDFAVHHFNLKHVLD
ncbi:hypothetical protein FGB62_247g05 [Gracilaria domingensis]|nr:hypothetical protein FGB62_247g05 [Gracilaria domingensis]